MKKDHNDDSLITHVQIWEKLETMDVRNEKTHNQIWKKLKNHDAQFLKINEILEDHDDHFSRIDKKLLEHDKNFDRIIAKLLEHDRRLDEMVTRKEFNEFKDYVCRTLDAIINKLDMLLGEKAITDHQISRHEANIKRLNGKVFGSQKLIESA